ncbi:MAG: VWA domain-containing protein [Pyrinomonadaceae bacterium]|nr:VWA domain-containing protein [Pyrinomonadaceae bacterium]
MIFKNSLSRRLIAGIVAFLFAAASVPVQFSAFAQSRRQPPTAPQKKNQRPGEEKKQGGEQPQEEPLPADILKTPQDEVIKVAANLVNIETVVYHKKTGQIVTGLTKENFAIFEDDVQQPITNFSTPDAPITVAMVLEYSRLTEAIGGSRFEPGRYEVIRPLALFLSRFVRPETDFVSVTAYDMRPTPLTDFTNDPRRLNEVINLLLRNRPASSEANLFDALKLTLVGGRGDSVVLEDSKEAKAEYAGLSELQGRRRALFLISSGIDTFSKINYDDARKIAQNSGVPIYIIGTGNLFFKRFEDRLGPLDSLTGFPGRMSFLQAQNALRTFAKETGGAYFPVTFEGELNSVLSSITGLMRSQYSLGYNPGERRDGKRHEIEVKVDVDGDGQYDDKLYEVNHRKYYLAPKA